MYKSSIILKECGKVIKKISIGAASMNANSTCLYFLYQEKMPDAIKKLRKF